MPGPRTGLVNQEPAVHIDHLGGDVTGVVGGEERDEIRDVLRTTEPPDGDPGGEVGDPGEHRRVDQRRREAFAVMPWAAYSLAIDFASAITPAFDAA